MCGQLRTNFSSSGTKLGSSVRADGEDEEEGGDKEVDGSSCDLIGEPASENWEQSEKKSSIELFKA